MIFFDEFNYKIDWDNKWYANKFEHNEKRKRKKIVRIVVFI